MLLLSYSCDACRVADVMPSKGPFTQAIFVAATQCNSMQFLSRRSCNQLRFHCDFSAICQCKSQYTSIAQTKAVCLIKGEITTQSHRVS